MVTAGAANVVYNLLSVIAFEHTGRRIIIEGSERYYEHKLIGVRTKIYRVKGEYVFEYDVIPHANTQGNEGGHAMR